MKNDITLIARFWYWLSGLFTTGVKEKLDAATDETKRVVEDAVEDVKDTVKETKRKVKDVVEDVKDTVKETKRKVEDAVEDVVESVEESKDTIEEIVEEVTEVLTSKEFKKGRFSEDEVKTLINETKDKDFKEVNWEALSAGMNRKIDALKSKVKSLNK